MVEELNRRRAVVFVHPTASPDPEAHALGLPDSLLDFVVDTSRAIAHLHYTNTFARTPNIKYIFSHAGGTIPYLASRFAVVDEMSVIDGQSTHRRREGRSSRGDGHDAAASHRVQRPKPHLARTPDDARGITSAACPWSLGNRGHNVTSEIAKLCGPIRSR
jgi:Amidohydrolase